MVTEKQYIISHRRPHQWLLAILIAVLLAVLIQWYLNRWLNAEQFEQAIELEQQNEQLLIDQQALKQINQDLTTQLNDQQQTLAMNAVTDQQLREDLKKLQDTVIELNKELLFYQNITQGNASSELQIRELHLRLVNETERQYLYRIVITQGKKVTKAIKGDVDVYLHSANNDKRLLNQHALKLRNVQVLEGSIKLDEQELPSSLFIQLKQGKKTLTERSFDWEVESSAER